MTAQDTGKFRSNEKDQFYTKPMIAKLCIEKLLTWNPEIQTYRWIEPSAGSGSFLGAVPHGTEVLAIDIDPRRPFIKTADFLKWMPPSTEKKTLLLGNPPFGRQASLARKFIGKGVSIADVIAFILPRSFTKPSMQKAFPGNFHLALEFELPKNSFLVNEDDYDVPCVFQIWEKRAEKRAAPQEEIPRGFTYVKSTDAYDLIIRRVGVYAGVCGAETGAFSPQSHYFVLLDEEHKPKKENIALRMSEHTFPTNTTGPRSLSKPEINLVLNAILSSDASDVEQTQTP